MKQNAIHRSSTLKALTLRNAPPRVALAIRERAHVAGVSLNRAVIALLEEHLAEAEVGGPARFHDLDELAGTWSKEEGRAFDKALRKQRKIDPELWG